MRIVGFCAILAATGCASVNADNRAAARGKLALYMGLPGSEASDPSPVDCFLDRMDDRQVRAFLRAKAAPEQSDVLGGIQDLSGLSTCLRRIAS